MRNPPYSFTLLSIISLIEKNHMTHSNEKLPVLAIVVPCYCESEVIDDSSSQMLKVLKQMIEEKLICSSSYIAFIDDGSHDDTWTKINLLTLTHPPFIKGAKLSRNFGHQSAVFAGLSGFTATAYITIDADLQDDIQVIPQMVKNYRNGDHVVYGVRADRQSDSMLKRSTAQGFYKLMEWMRVKSVYNHADFRLMSAEVVKELIHMQEVHLFLRAMVPLIGYPSSVVTYRRGPRLAGESKYPLKKMLVFAWNGITSFSTFPLQLISFFGFLFALGSLVGVVLVILAKFSGNTIPGWTSLAVILFFLGGVHMLALGILGSYVGKIYEQVKHRPRFIIQEFKGLDCISVQEEGNDEN